MFEHRSVEFQRFMQSIYEHRAAMDAGAKDLPSIRNTMNSFIGAFKIPADVKVLPQDCDGVSAEWITAPESDLDRIVLYLHGGCYISGSPGVVREFGARLARSAKARVLSIDYRLAPEHPFPAAIDDCVTSYRWLLANGFSPRRIAIAGESAGGGLTFALLMQCRELKLPMPACGLPISPWVDMEVQFGGSLTRNLGIDMASTVPLHIGAEAYVGKLHRRHPLASPLYGDLSGLPPILIQVGTSEVLLDEGLEIARRAQAAGCDVTLEKWEDMGHVWHWYGPLFPEAQQAIDALGRYILDHT